MSEIETAAQPQPVLPHQRHAKKWRFRISRKDLLACISRRLAFVDIARLHGVDKAVITTAVDALSARYPKALGAAVTRSMAIRVPDYAMVRAHTPIEPVDATEALLVSVAGVRTIQSAFEKYIRDHLDTLTDKRHRPQLDVYLEASKVMAKVVHEIVGAQAKLSEWVGAEELRKLVVQTFDQLPARLEQWGRPVSVQEAAQTAKSLYLEALQGRIILLRQGRLPPVGPVPPVPATADSDSTPASQPATEPHDGDA